MKTIDELLATSASAKPRRALRADFTNQITHHIASHPRKTGVLVIWERSIMKFFTKPALAIATVGATLAIGGTAYAAIDGWNISALFGGQQNLPGGDRIVRVDTDNCTYISALNFLTHNTEPNTLYYKVKANSKLTNEQVVQMARGNCFTQQQAEFDQAVFNSVLNTPQNKGKIVGGYIDSVITAISPTSISIESDIPMGPEIKKVKQTFNHIDPNVLVYSSPHKIAYSSLKIGDHVSVSYRASGDALLHSETIAPDQINAGEQVLVTINKNTPDMAAAVSYQKYNQTEFEQVVPCTVQSSGYCTLDELPKQ